MDLGRKRVKLYRYTMYIRTENNRLAIYNLSSPTYINIYI